MKKDILIVDGEEGKGMSDGAIKIEEMKKQWTLSDKINKGDGDIIRLDVDTIWKEDVKKFIKKLKEDFDSDGEYISLTVAELDKLAGDELTK